MCSYIQMPLKFQLQYGCTKINDKKFHEYLYGTRPLFTYLRTWTTIKQSERQKKGTQENPMLIFVGIQSGLVQVVHAYSCSDVSENYAHLERVSILFAQLASLPGMGTCIRTETSCEYMCVYIYIYNLVFCAGDWLVYDRCVNSSKNYELFIMVVDQGFCAFRALNCSRCFFAFKLQNYFRNMWTKGHAWKS